eukprot:GFYU01011577.1.p1 GENE.GFYU01011577.1~~GFYU01011577.1.p1  ORF type:complete len:359 (-),score=34.74 GFYU01011577.1:208-1284(-)
MATDPPSSFELERGEDPKNLQKGSRKSTGRKHKGDYDYSHHRTESIVGVDARAVSVSETPYQSLGNNGSSVDVEAHMSRRVYQQHQHDGKKGAYGSKNTVTSAGWSVRASAASSKMTGYIRVVTNQTPCASWMCIVLLFAGCVVLGLLYAMELRQVHRMTASNLVDADATPKSVMVCPAGDGFLDWPHSTMGIDNSCCQYYSFNCCGQQACKQRVLYETQLGGLLGATGECASLLGRLSCAPCAPYAAAYTRNFNITHPTPDRGQPIIVCPDYCRDMYTACLDEDVMVMSGALAKVVDLYPEYTPLFCVEQLQVMVNGQDGVEVPLCFNSAEASAPITHMNIIIALAVFVHILAVHTS